VKPAQIAAFFATLKAANPHPQTELEYASVFELLAAVLLSAQATDVGVNKATRRLFVVANTPKKILALGLEGLEAQIKTIGLFRSKARHLMQTCQILQDRYGGQVPRVSARCRPQDGQCGAQRRFRRSHYGGRHPFVPAGQPHRHGARSHANGG
jgi:endonuclease III